MIGLIIAFVAGIVACLIVQALNGAYWQRRAEREFELVKRELERKQRAREQSADRLFQRIEDRRTAQLQAIQPRLDHNRRPRPFAE